MLQLPAANLLFFYWPSLNPTSAERKDIADRFRYTWHRTRVKKITTLFPVVVLGPTSRLTKQRPFPLSKSFFSL
jgi:hypothetical protein